MHRTQLPSAHRSGWNGWNARAAPHGHTCPVGVHTRARGVEGLCGYGREGASGVWEAVCWGGVVHTRRTAHGGWDGLPQPLSRFPSAGLVQVHDALAEGAQGAHRGWRKGAGTVGNTQVGVAGNLLVRVAPRQTRRGSPPRPLPTP